MLFNRYFSALFGGELGTGPSDGIINEVRFKLSGFHELLLEDGYNSIVLL